jgi:hypothetical protein
MKNLFDETLNALNYNGKNLEDIISIQGDDLSISLGNFIEIAQSTNYDSGYGSQYVAKDLKIIGDGWWLERREYDGSEWWEFCTAPKLITEKRNVKYLACNRYGWSSLKELNG